VKRETIREVYSNHKIHFGLLPKKEECPVIFDSTLSAIRPLMFHKWTTKYCEISCILCRQFYGNNTEKEKKISGKIKKRETEKESLLLYFFILTIFSKIFFNIVIEREFIN